MSNIEHLPPEIPGDTEAECWHDTPEFKADALAVSQLVKEFIDSHLKSKSLLQTVNWAEQILLDWIQTHDDVRVKRTVFKSLLDVENRSSLGLIDGRQ